MFRKLTKYAKARLDEPTTYLGAGAVAVGVSEVLGRGADKAQIAVDAAGTVASGLAGGLGLIPSLLLAVLGVIGVVKKEKGNAQND